MKLIFTLTAGRTGALPHLGTMVRSRLLVNKGASLPIIHWGYRYGGFELIKPPRGQKLNCG